MYDPRKHLRLSSRLASMVTSAALATLLWSTADAIEPNTPIMQPKDPAQTSPSTIRPAFSAGSQFSAALSSNATGIYSLGTSNFGTYGAATTFALIHGGQIRQVQSKSGGRWLTKQAGSAGGISVSGAKFDQLMQIAGGANRNVNTMAAATRDAFLCAATLSTANCPTTTGSGAGPGPGGTWPLEIPPTGGSCPTGYGLKMVVRADGSKVVVCQLLTQQIDLEFDADRALLAALGSALQWLIPAAEARDCGPIGCLSYFSFGEIGAFRFRFEYNEQSGFWGFNGFGIVAVFMLPEPGG